MRVRKPQIHLGMNIRYPKERSADQDDEKQRVSALDFREPKEGTEGREQGRASEDDPLPEHAVPPQDMRAVVAEQRRSAVRRAVRVGTKVGPLGLEPTGEFYKNGDADSNSLMCPWMEKSFLRSFQRTFRPIKSHDLNCRMTVIKQAHVVHIDRCAEIL